MLQKNEKNRMSKEIITDGRKKYLEDLNELNRVFPVVEIEKISLQEEFMKHQPISKLQEKVKTSIIMAKQLRIRNFRAPIYDPSFTDDGKNIVYEPNKKPAVANNLSFSKISKLYEDFMPEMNSRIGTSFERYVFLGYIIKELVDREHIEPELAWYLVCDESSKIAPYETFEKTGTYPVGKWYDLGNTCKITIDIERIIKHETIDRYITVFGGNYQDNSTSRTLAHAEKFAIFDKIQLETLCHKGEASIWGPFIEYGAESVVWMVMDEEPNEVNKLPLNEKCYDPIRLDSLEEGAIKRPIPIIDINGKDFEKTFPIVEVEKISLSDSFLQTGRLLEGEENIEFRNFVSSIKETIIWAKKKEMQNFRTPFCAPSLSYDGKSIVYELGRKPLAFSGATNHFDKIFEHFIPEKHSRLMNVREMHVFIGAIIKYLVEEEGYSVNEAWSFTYDYKRKVRKKLLTGEFCIGKWYDLHIPTATPSDGIKINGRYYTTFKVGDLLRHSISFTSGDVLFTEFFLKGPRIYRLIMDV